jgi:cell division protein FtsI (penicillin-binding protein 3)
MEGREARRFQRRVRLILAAFLGGLGLVAARAAQLQVEQHEHLARLARDQYLNTVKIPARRGNIYDRAGAPLAISVDVPSVYANPAAVSDPRGTARALAKVLGLDARELADRLSGERYFVWLRRQVSPEVAERVRALRLVGISITKEPRRFYPNREIGSQVVGFAGLDGRGLEGIEKQFDAELIGEPQTVPAVRDARGQAVLAGGLDPDGRSRGSDVRLTLDLHIQHLAEQTLARTVAATRAKGAHAVVLDVASGDVLAMATVPTFNPNGGAAEKAERRRNRIVTDMFEPGSIIKPLVVAAALDAGAIHPRTVLFCENGRYPVGGHTISDTSPHGWMGLTEILAKSSNIGMAKIAEVYGKPRLEEALRRFGIGRRTGIEFPGEVAGVLRPSAHWSDLEAATISFGQGMATNALQLAAAYRVLAAEGAYREPRLVRAFERSDGSVRHLPLKPERTVITVESARRVTAMLEAAIVPQEGTGRLAAVPGYRAAGKTGTAQKADPLTGGYSRDRYIALFAGYLPAEAPRVVITVAVDEPQTSHFGGVVAAPVFSELGAATMQRLGVLASAGALELPTSVETAAVAAAAPAEVPVVDAPVEKPGSVPSFVGLTGKQAVARYVQLGWAGGLAMQGSGKVVQQEPTAGSRRPDGRPMRLVLAP